MKQSCTLAGLTATVQILLSHPDTYSALEYPSLDCANFCYGSAGQKVDCWPEELVHCFHVFGSLQLCSSPDRLFTHHQVLQTALSLRSEIRGRVKLSC